jgi:hypothetical protein
MATNSANISKTKNHLSPIPNTKKPQRVTMKGHERSCINTYMWLLGNTYIVFNVMNYLPIKHQWLSNKQLSFTFGVISPLRYTALSKEHPLVVRDEYNSTKITIRLLL